MRDKVKIFISHASEDKKEIALPIALALREHGIDVWLDQYVLTLGDSLMRSIDEGLRNCDYGIVILSKSFFNKEWPQKELAGLVQKEDKGKKVILPIWHKIDKDDVAEYSPILADKVAVKTESGMPNVVNEIIRSIGANEIHDLSSSVEEHRKPDTVADVDVTYRQLVVDKHFHVYSLSVRVNLNSPPDQGRMRLSLEWPSEVRVIKDQGVELVGRTVVDGKVRSREYRVDWEKRIFCGESVVLVGDASGNKIEYILDSVARREIEENSPVVRYKLYLEDHLPVEGVVPMSSLHVF